jgi:hypothetical protein
VMVAVTIKQARTFTSVVQMLVFPMIFLSGALYPVSDLPAWLAVLNRVNPLTYAVDVLRRLVFGHLDVAESARRARPRRHLVGLARAPAARGGDRAGAGPGDAGDCDRPVQPDGVKPRRVRTSRVSSTRDSTSSLR